MAALKDRAILPYAINLMLDPVASMQVERTYVSLAALSIRDEDLVTQYGACVTLLIVADTVHPDDLDETLKRAVAKSMALPVELTTPCMIAGTPPVLSLRVAPASALLDLHHAIYRTLPVQAVHLHHRPAYWQPHLKLANVRADQAAAAKLVAALSASWSPMSGVLDNLEVVQYPPVQSIFQAPLRRIA